MQKKRRRRWIYCRCNRKAVPDFSEGLDDELNAKLEEIAANMTEVPSDEEINEMVYQAMYDIISPKLSNMEYGDPVTVTIPCSTG